MEDQDPYGPPELTMLACGVITPTEVRTSRVTPSGLVIHERNTVPVEHHAYTPVSTGLSTASWLALAFLLGWVGYMLAQVGVAIAGRAGL